MLPRALANVAMSVLTLVTVAATQAPGSEVLATDASSGRVELELTYPAGASPRVFTTGWLFGARASLVSPGGGVTDLSDQVQWSGSGGFQPAIGALSRPSFGSPGSNTIELAVTVGDQVVRRQYLVEAVRPNGYAAVGSQAFNAADAHGCPACAHPVIGPIITGSTTVTIGGSPAARKGDRGVHAACCGPNTFEVTGGDTNVLIDGRPAARIGDSTLHCGGTGSIVSPGFRVSPRTNGDLPAEMSGAWIAGDRYDVSEGGWERGEYSDGGGGNWVAGRRADSADSCSGPRPEFQRSLARIRTAMEQRDIEAVVAAVRTVKPACPGDADRLSRLRDAAVAVAQGEADSNEARMRSDMQDARARRASNAAAWASALGTLDGILREVGGASAGSTGSPTFGTAAVPSSGGSGGKQCLVDSRAQIDPPRAGVTYQYYVLEGPFPGTSKKAFKILQWSGSASSPPQLGGGERTHGPYSTAQAARAALDRLCPPAVRATDGIRLR